ncbi:flagellar filament capping protein FliD [Cohnella caldifontis]|uniref:flagellar filament capping protein FliD n=1 Tax=Cohnella caldifontis TaxID=3027471 RepID=UPI0023EC617F|nr:flagellar cap protein FliD N-terminal domain-containing protein [Cohnella sp. YIM B05605]
MPGSIPSVQRIMAATYAHNLTYYRQPVEWPFAKTARGGSSSPADPLYRAAASGLSSVLKGAKDLRASAEDLLDSGGSAFQSREARSSDKTAVAASASDGAKIASYRIKVDQTAAAQVNGGTWLSAASPAAIQGGTNEMKITVGGKTSYVSAFISGSDTNGQALAKIRDAINGAHAGVTARIVNDAKAGTARLELTGDATGAKNAFGVADVTGNAAAAAGIRNVTAAAADAVYSVNGGPIRISSSNTIELEKGKASATLLKPTSQDAEVRVEPNAQEIVDRVKRLAADYNALRRRMDESGAFLSPSVRRGLDSAVQGYESIGLRRKADGTLELDESKFKASLESRYDDTRDDVSGRFGLAGKLSSAAGRLEDVPPASLLSSSFRNLQTTYASKYRLTLQPGLLFDGSF